MDIKLNSKYTRLLAFLIVLLSALFLSFLLFYLIDHTFNGVFVDWFERNYTVERYITESGHPFIRRELLWPQIKQMLLQILTYTLLLWLVTVLLTAHFYARRKIGKLQADVQEKQKKLKEENERKNDLITYLAHDLKTPLTSVIGYLSFLDEVPDMPHLQQTRYIHVSLDKARRLETLVNEFFEITRYNLQEIWLEKEQIDLYYMLVQMADEFYPILKSHGNTIQLEVDEEASVYGDPVKLARVFNNILKNAVTYSYPGTAIQIRTEETQTNIRIFFQNKGKTIPEHRLETIFDKFFRLDDARVSATGGAGLGLAIAKEIIESHKGTVTAHSEDEQTTFCVTLPAAKAVT